MQRWRRWAGSRRGVSSLVLAGAGLGYLLQQGTVSAGQVPGAAAAVLAGAAARWEQETAPAASGPASVMDALVESVAAGVRLHALAGAYAAASPQGAGGTGVGGHPIAALDIAAALGPARLELNRLQAVPPHP